VLSFLNKEKLKHLRIAQTISISFGVRRINSSYLLECGDKNGDTMEKVKE
jgi:hypothetical protein